MTTYKSAVLLYLCAFLLTQAPAKGTPRHFHVSSRGQTILTGSLEATNVQVTIVTHELKEWSRDEANPRQPDSNCVTERTPCSIVDSIKILVNGKSVFVFRSVYADLGDLNDAELTIGKKTSTLTLRGGDASEAFQVKIEFDAQSVIRRTVAGAMDFNEPTQVTTYHIVTIGD